MDRDDVILIAQVGILALLIFSFQVIFEFAESFFFSMDYFSSNYFSLALLIINPIIAVIILGYFYCLFLNKPMPRVVKAYAVLLYVSIQFVVSNIYNGYYIQSVAGTIFTSMFYVSMGVSILIFFLMYFILTSCFDMISYFMFRKKEALKMNVPLPKHDALEMNKEIPKEKLQEQEEVLVKTPKIAVYSAKKKIKAKKSTVKKAVIKKKSSKKRIVKSKSVKKQATIKKKTKQKSGK